MKARDRVLWRGSRDGPWPSVHIGGDLERASAEWLHTNGAGAYSMSTVALMHTRRHHGLLIAALPAPLGRYVVLSHNETSVTTAQRTHRLSTHQFPNVAPTHGYRLLESFAQDPLPRWVYRLSKMSFERTLALVRGKNAVVVGYTWHGRVPARLSIRPLMPLREVASLMSEHGAMAQRIILRSGEVEMQPVPSLPPVVFGHSGVFVGSPDWWRRFEYLGDRERHPDFQEDIWTPGVFEFDLEYGVTRYLWCSVGDTLGGDPATLMAEAAEHARRQDPGPKYPAAVRLLSVAADQFCADEREQPTIIAGYPFYDVYARDLLIALPGLYLSRGRISEALQVLDNVLRVQRGGLLPESLERLKTTERRYLPDATLWLFEVARALLGVLGPRHEFVVRRLYPALRRAFVRISGKRRRVVWLSANGLVVNGHGIPAGLGSIPPDPLTWMNARIGGRAPTLRAGVAVELQALWTRGCETFAAVAREQDDHRTADAAERACAAARTAFRARFWCNETRYPFDCISETRGTADTWADPSIRPNAVIALAIDPSLFETWQAASIVERARRELLTPRGLRTLSPHDRAYSGLFGGTADERALAAHQGPAWTYLLGFFVRAARRVAPEDGALAEELRDLLEGAGDGGPVLGQVAQLADGDQPYRPKGCPAQAWSVGELLRTLVDEYSMTLQQASTQDDP
jgi:glycogen debranching enzyme